jgi:cell shape-determining protein MreC
MDNRIVVSLTIFVITHVVATVWWASKMNTLMQVVQTSLHELVVEVKAMKEIFITKEDVTRELVSLENENKAQWKKIDYLTEKFNTIGG